jgi:PAS domain S-box-containing protein
MARKKKPQGKPADPAPPAAAPEPIEEAGTSVPAAGAEAWPEGGGVTEHKHRPQKKAGLSPDAAWHLDPAQLRQRAEQEAKARGLKDADSLSPEEVRRLLHELQVNQIELEMQNEELRRTQQELEASWERYFDLYDLAPVGYCTFSEEGLILEANLTLATQLGVARNALARQPLSKFVFREDEDTFYLHRQRLFETGQPQSCELRLTRNDGGLLWARLEATVAESEAGEPVCRLVMSDITERKRAEEALRRAEENFRRSQDESPLGVRIVTADGETLYANRAMLDIYGYDSIEELRTTPVKQRYTPESYADFEIRKEKRQQGEYVPSEYEVSIVRKNGEVRHLQVFRKAVLWNGEMQFQAVHQDITERKRAEAALIEERHLLYTLMDNLPDNIYFKDRESRFTQVNQALARLFGLDDLRRAIGKTDFDLFTDEHALQAFADEQKIISSGQPLVGMEEKETWPDGRVTWVSTTKMPLRDSHGNIIGTFGISRDVTARKRAEESLRASESRYRLLFENNVAAIIRNTLDGRIVDCNDSAAQSLGFESPQEVLGLNVRDLHWDPEKRAELVARLRSEKALVGVELKLRRRDGGEIWVLAIISLTPSDDTGETFIQGTFVDITERKRTEEALRRSEARLKEALLAAQMGVWEWTPATDTVTWDENLYRIAGRDPKSPAPSSQEQQQIYAPESWERLKAAVENTLSTGTPFETDLELVRPDGSERWWIGRGEPLRDASGRITQFRGTVQDITERKQAEEEMFRSRQMLQSVLDHIPQGVFWKDRDGVYLGGNKKFAVDAGLASPDQVPGNTDFALAWGLQPQACAYRADDQLVMENDSPKLNYEEVMPNPGGHVSWVRTSKIPLHDREGKVIGMLGTYEDITERKRAEEAARRAGAYNRSLIEASLDPLVTIAPDGKITDVNNATEKVTGVSRQQLIGTDFSDYFTDSGRARAGYEQVFREGLVQDYELEIRHGDGHVTPVLYNAAVYRDEAGDVIGVFAAARDITERQRAEEALRESEARFRTLITDARVAMGESRNGIALFVNTEFARLFGLQNPEETFGRTILDYLAPQCHESMKDMIRRRQQGLPTSTDFESIGRRKDGSTFPMHCAVSRINLADGPVTLAFLTDLTERQRAEEERQRSLEQLRALAGRLQNIREEERKRVARDVHDHLGQALVAIKFDLYSLGRELAGDPHQTAERMASVLKMVDEAIQSVHRVSTDLRPPMLDHLGLVATVEWAGEDFESRTGIKCKLHLTEGDLAIDSGKATALYRILQELLTNVAQHAAATQVEIELAMGDKDVVLTVRDNGKGMPAEKFSAKESLGILGMQERALAFGGELILCSAPGAGTSVRVRIPH